MYGCTCVWHLLMADSEEVSVSGDIFIPSHDDREDSGTLEEPISKTLVSYDCVIYVLPNNTSTSIML